MRQAELRFKLLVQFRYPPALFWNSLAVAFAREAGEGRKKPFEAIELLRQVELAKLTQGEYTGPAGNPAEA